MFRRACEAPVQEDGIRRSKGVIVRNTLQQLKTTCLVSITQLFRPIMHYKVSDQTIEIRMPGVEADWLMLPLDTVENQQRLLSLELTYAWLSEFREIDHEIAQAVLSRCGRYPSRAMLQPDQHNYWYGMFMETNSFSEDSPWYEALEEELPSNWDYFVQPGAFEPDAENLENLPPSYYQDLMESNSAAWVEQYIHNKITPSLSGQAVFRNSFSPDFHISDTELRPVPGYPLIVGVDSGRTPAAVICQLDNIGRLLVLQSIVTQKHESMGMIKFLEERLRPALQHERLVGNSAFLIVDPAAVAKSQIGESSVIEAIHEAGFQVIKALTNDIDPRLRAVEKYLSEQRNGGAAVLFDAVWTHELILAMQSKYRYKIKKDKSMEEKPDKTHPWSDVCDALQYACLGTNSGLRGRMMRTTKPVPVREPTAAGWT